MLGVGLLALAWGIWLLGWPKPIVAYVRRTDRHRLMPTVSVARVYGIASIVGGFVLVASGL